MTLGQLSWVLTLGQLSWVPTLGQLSWVPSLNQILNLTPGPVECPCVQLLAVLGAEWLPYNSLMQASMVLNPYSTSLSLIPVSGYLLSVVMKT